MTAQTLTKVCIVCRRDFPGSVEECPEDLVKLSIKDSRIGSTFDGKYEILDFIGIGGLSRVYKARHKELNRILALKILKSSDIIDLQRFRREAVSIDKLEHINIARVFSFSVSIDGLPYMALEYLDGKDLAKQLNNGGQLTVAQAINIFDQVAAALEHAHSRGVIHRDIKPSNIVLLGTPDELNNVKVVDFGMARLIEVDQSQSLSLPGQVLGTNQYISPEQFDGNKADERADIYALGITLKESVIRDGKIPDKLKAIVSKSTEHLPENRFQTASELREAIQNLKVSLDMTGPITVGPSAFFRPGNDLFSQIYFWSMLAGIIVVASCAAIVFKQRQTAWEALQKTSPSHKSASPHVLGFEGTRTQADKLTDAGELNEAINLYQEWLKQNRNSKNIRAQIAAKRCLAAIFLRKQEPDIAYEILADCESALKSNSNSTIQRADILLNMAYAESLRKAPAKGLHLAKQALELCKGAETERKAEVQLAVLMMLARIYLELNQPDKAIKCCEEGMVAVNKGQSCKYMALAYIEKSNLPKALEYINQGVDAGDKIPYKLLDCITVRAQVYALMNKVPEAKEDMAKTIIQLNKLPVSNPQMNKEMKTRLKHCSEILSKNQK